MSGERDTIETIIAQGIDPATLARTPLGKAYGHTNGGPPLPDDDDEGTEDAGRATDVWHARELCKTARHAARYSEPEQAWYVFQGGRWLKGSANLVTPFVHLRARALYRAASTAPIRADREFYAKEGRRLETDRTIKAILNQAKALPDFQIDPLVFDRDPDLLNVLNGTIDLRTGELRAHDPEDLISKVCPVMYIPDAESELWNNTIALASARMDKSGTIEYDPEMEAFFRRRAGYALTGHTSEKVMFVDYGGTGTGKTSINVPLSKMLGPDYSKSIRPEALLAQREPAKIPHEIAALRGMRLVICSEVPGLKRFNEALLKDLTGGDPISACFKYGREFNFTPQLTLIMYSNHRPEFSGTDDAVWARARSVPFAFQFNKYGGVDPEAREKLQQPEHQQAILAWAVRGCLEWRENGMQTPDKVMKDTEAHRADVSSVGKFLAEKCNVGEFVPPEAATFQALHRSYGKWDKQQPAPEKLGAGPFALELSRLGHELKKVITQARNTANVSRPFA